MNELEEHSFKELIDGIEDPFRNHAQWVEQDIKAVAEDLTALLHLENIQFQEPIPWRIKTLDSAKGSLRRRTALRAERKILQNRLEKHGRSWEEYWEKRDQPHRIDDTEPFKTPQEMVDALHDIGGLRILVYFPNDVEKVAKILESLPNNQKRLNLRHKRTSPSHRTDPHIQQLKQFLEELDGPENGKPRGDISVGQQLFAGYRATHILIEVQRSPEYHVVMEVQVTTVVMNAWSQVEHDIIYKPTELPDEEEIRILDTFNGIVMIGENALRQLESIQQRKARLENERYEKHAEDKHEVANWLRQHCKNCSITPPNDWSHLDELWDVLRIRDKDTSGHIKDIIREIWEIYTDERTFNAELPLLVIQQVCHEMPTNTKLPYPNREFNSAPINAPQHAIRNHARYLALLTVRVLNMAICLQSQAFINAIRDATCCAHDRPSVKEFLRVLRPECLPQSSEAYDRIARICTMFLEAAKFEGCLGRPSEIAHLRLPMELVMMGYITVEKDTVKENVPRSIPLEVVHDIVPSLVRKLLLAESNNKAVPKEVSLPCSSFYAFTPLVTDWVKSSNSQPEFEIRKTNLEKGYPELV